MDALYAVSALDGRYAGQLQGLSELVSEAALIRYRIMVEAAWLLHLGDGPAPVIALKPDIRSFLADLAREGGPREAAVQVKALERTTNHDVKAVEYWLRDALQARGADMKVLSHIHFACTSEDINNVAYALMMRDVRAKILLPTLDRILEALTLMARSHRNAAMMSRTHGQSASATTMGKELAVFVYRLGRQRQALSHQDILAKFNGAVGNFNAHAAALPQLRWQEISRSFVETRMGFVCNPLSTQIESHDWFVEFMQTVRHTNTILLDLCRDMWGYISLGYFAQKAVAGEVGSSTMPHKVNPIYFENAEGNLGVASSLMQHFGDKLPMSRWQRDLSDSTVLRVTGTAIGHSVVAWNSILKGLERVALNPQRMLEDLENAWELLAEPVQTVMRHYGVTDAYERLKDATRGESFVTRQMIHAAIDSCAVIPDHERDRMKQWRPKDYIGLAPELVDQYLPVVATTTSP